MWHQATLMVSAWLSPYKEISKRALKGNRCVLHHAEALAQASPLNALGVQRLECRQDVVGLHVIARQWVLHDVLRR